MKKAIAILLVLLVAGVAFGADPTLVIGTTRTGVESIKLSVMPLTTSTYGAASEDLSIVMNSVQGGDDVPPARAVYVNLRTNTTSSYNIGVSGLPLSSATTDSKIGYTLTPQTGTGYTPGSTLTVASTAETAVEDSAFITYAANGTSGLTVTAARFDVALSATDWIAAIAASDYTTTVTVSLSTI